MKVFITGATGFVGGHVARELASRGADLRILTRRTSNLANLEGLVSGSDAETVIGDLLQPDSLRNAIRG